MRIVLNGEPYEMEQPLTVAELIARLRLSGKRVAVERNGKVLPRAEYATTRLDEGDRIEIVHFVGGG